MIFEADLLEIESKMSGWHNLLFVAEDIQIDPTLIVRLMKYEYKNYLAHIYVYSYDNAPGTIAMASRSEAFLKYFSQGIAIAKEIDNEVLMYNAYQKNLMIAATNGMSDIALLFDVRMYQSVKDKKSLEGARVLSSIGYNLSASGYTQEAFCYFDRAIELLYELQEGHDIAEVLYNKGINYLAIRDYENAENCFHFVLKIINRLHLNSIRVCNLSKLYALMALVSILQNKKINCERYLISCRQFLEYVMEKEGSKEKIVVLHDYLLADDDISAPCYVSDKMIASFVRRVGAELDYKTHKQYIAFISQWQKILDNKDNNIDSIVDEAMKSFLNYFNNDKALYIRCSDSQNTIYFDNSERTFSEEELNTIVNGIKEYPEGFVVSKIGDSFYEHSDVISIFGSTDVFSFAGIPIFNNIKLEAVFITYVLMVDNWHNSFSRIMFSEDELSLYTLLFRNLEDGISRIEATQRVKEMNTLLEKNSVTDILTGLYNRFGLYREVKKIMDKEELVQRAEHIYSMIKESDGFRDEIQTLLGQKLDKNACDIGCSIGIATAEELVAGDIDKLIKLADDTLYSVKLKNKGTYAFL